MARVLTTRSLARAPIRLYQIGLGWGLGSRLMMLEHVGRKSGQPRYVCLEVVERPRPDLLLLASGFGTSSQWYRNLRAQPECFVSTGRLKRAPACAPSCRMRSPLRRWTAMSGPIRRPSSSCGRRSSTRPGHQSRTCPWSNSSSGDRLRSIRSSSCLPQRRQQHRRSLGAENGCPSSNHIGRNIGHASLSGQHAVGADSFGSLLHSLFSLTVGRCLSGCLYPSSSH